MSQNMEIGENKLGTMPIGKLLVSMSLPTTFSMLIMAMYNIVDSIFVSRYSEAALTAVSLAFPMQNLMIAFRVGTDVGITSVVSRRLGEKREEEARKSAETGFLIEMAFMLMFVVLGLVFSKPFISLYTKDQQLIDMGTTYLRICLMISVGTFVNVFCEKTLQATGDTIHPMIIQASGAIFNIIFDPILIFGLFGLPAMGVAGAAIATVAGQIFAMFVGLISLKKNKYLKMSIFKCKFDKASAKDILSVGIPSVIMQGIGTIMTSLMNAILIAYDFLATTFLGVYFKLQSFVFMPVFGMNSGLMPILGYNFGAKNKARLMKALKLGMIVAAFIMTFGAVIFMLFPDVLMGMFNASDNLLAIGRSAMWKIALSFPLASICIMLGSLYQAIGDGYLSMITSIVRQIGFLVPLSWILGKLFGLDAIWFSYIMAEVISLILNLFFFKVEKKRLNF